MSTFQRQPFQVLDDRMAGKDPEPVLREGVPSGLVQPLREWLRAVFNTATGPTLAKVTCLRLDIAVGNYTYESVLQSIDSDRLLEVVDAVLQLNVKWENYEWEDRSIEPVLLLDGLLTHAGSVYEVNWDATCLTSRVDPTVRAAIDQAAATATPDAADHLRRAFAEAYGMQPNPDTSYDESVRAVEAAYCPLVLAKKAGQGTATLGTVLGELRSNKKWRLRLPDNLGAYDTSADTVVAMLSSLWEGQVSRHAGGPHSRRQTQDEAETAVHLAATLVHWATSGVLFQP